jgi:YgiT-type zinc finger domain-containing protein
LGVASFVETEIMGEEIICTLCGVAGVQPTLARSAFWNNDRLVVVEDIPALVCPNCHEQFFGDDVAMTIDLMRGGGFPVTEASKVLSVPVFSFRQMIPRASLEELESDA